MTGSQDAGTCLEGTGMFVSSPFSWHPVLGAQPQQPWAAQPKSFWHYFIEKLLHFLNSAGTKPGSQKCALILLLSMVLAEIKTLLENICIFIQCLANLGRLPVLMVLHGRNGVHQWAGRRWFWGAMKLLWIQSQSRALNWMHLTVWSKQGS